MMSYVILVLYRSSGSAAANVKQASQYEQCMAALRVPISRDPRVPLAEDYSVFQCQGKKSTLNSLLFSSIREYNKASYD